jgi:RNA-binding protein
MLTSKQRSYLRSIGNTMEPIFQVGKEGIGEAFLKQVEDALEARELIKLAVLRNSDLDAREACGEICSAIEAEPVQVIGNRFIIYKKSKEKPRIELPVSKVKK